jgi:hypothetical protein
MCLNRQREYSASAVSAARDFTSAAIISAVHPRGWAVADDTTLVVDELVTAALEAGAERVAVQVVLHWDEIDVTVRDDRTTVAEPGVTPVRQLILEGLTSRVDTRRLPEGGWESRGHVPCEPDHLREVDCRFRPR